MKLAALTILFVAASICLGLLLPSECPWLLIIVSLTIVVGYFWASRQDLGCDD
jgi:hypothetical protein